MTDLWNKILLGWFYWNPSREIFTVPILDRPITWYGVLFVLGFILGYFLIIPHFTRLLYQSGSLSPLDIKDWRGLIHALNQQEASDPLLGQIWRSFPASIKNRLKEWMPGDQIDDSLKKGILTSLNGLLQSERIERSDLEAFFNPFIQSAKQTSYILADRLCWFLVIGTVVGARLGVVLFYDWAYYVQHPIDIFKVWNGGLASHGGTLGVVVAAYCYVLYIRKWVPSINFLSLLDAIAIPAALTAFFIRIGNFVNQEIIGTPTHVPWGVIFGNPWGDLGQAPVSAPRHPVQLYEAAAYLSIFIVLSLLWKFKSDKLKTGTLSGLLLIGVYSSRIILEIWKANQESILSSSSLQMGQILSIPFILLGLFFLFYHKANHYLFCSSR